MDSIESADVLELVGLAFKVSSKDKISSKILVTTRMREIGEIVVANNGYIYTTRCLTKDEGWELLKKNVAPPDMADPGNINLLSSYYCPYSFFFYVLYLLNFSNIIFFYFLY